ncbi:hypothetical protein [Streptococcus acidominimus]|nr:hypothetical protein [Streptococcus acidominimus]MBF0848953.1 hypothetical protein [Streptococcus danieliae]QBX13661.1 hypothetical protein Javan1_0021 [Streptococcus phage Javan1]MBF0818728.1 hypothetical protein [Streptococcus acidominimus]MBF0838328.1 hypothetical protein [Streptococcus acidominimus]SUN05172.1 Uncharacterised protein [Streptococcus acidominimus]
MSKRSNDYKNGYRDAIRFAISEIDENIDNFSIDEGVGNEIVGNLKTIFRKVYQDE